MAPTKYPGISVRTLASGEERFDVRYRLPSGQVRTITAKTIGEARRRQAAALADRARGGLVDPKAGRVLVAEYVEDWIEGRVLAVRTRDLYRDLLRLHVAPELGRVQIGKLDPATVRRWHARRVRQASHTTAAKAYRLLHAAMATAVADGLLVANPCQVQGAGRETAAPRPTVTPEVVWALADNVAERRRPMVLLAGFCGLRLGEVLGLAVRHIDAEAGTVLVERQLQEQGGRGAQVFGPPKSDAGVRLLRPPAAVMAELVRHLEAMDLAAPDALLFTGEKGGPLRRSVWRGEWVAAREAAGVPGLRFHDLRHTALTLYAVSGATVRELQAQAGHASPAAAMRYQHASQDRAAALAQLVDRVIAQAEARDGRAMADPERDDSQARKVL